ncbi:MAG: hypothetical protein AAF575_00025 [Bacteroidota bacterium]
MSEKKEKYIIGWQNMKIVGGGLLDVGNKINDAQKSDKLYGKYKGKHGKWIYWTKIEIDSLPNGHRKHFVNED